MSQYHYDHYDSLVHCLGIRDRVAPVKYRRLTARNIGVSFVVSLSRAALSHRRLHPLRNTVPMLSSTVKETLCVTRCLMSMSGRKTALYNEEQEEIMKNPKNSLR